MSIELRKVTPEEGLRAGSILDYAMDDSPQPPEDEAELLTYLPYFEDGANLLAYDDGELVGGAYNFVMTQNIRGHLYASGGVWGVSTIPEVRRKGYVRRLMALLLENARDDGQIMSNLYPFRQSFYERMGYNVLPANRNITIDPAGLVPLLKNANFSGTCRRFLAKDAPEDVRSALEDQQKRIHGFMLRPTHSGIPRLRKSNQWVYLVQDDDGHTTGLMTYSIKSRDKMTVTTFHYEDSNALYRMLEWCARHTDQIKSVQIKLPPYGQPEAWFSDLDAKIEWVHAAMGRVLDVERLSGMWVGGGRFSAQIYDAICPWNNRTFLFEAVDGQLQVTPDQIADCDMSISALNALIYGTMPPDAFTVRKWTNADAHTLTMMAQMFPQKIPYLYEVF